MHELKKLQADIVAQEKVIQRAGLELRKLRTDLEEKHCRPHLARMVGRCFKFMNSYGMDEKWPLYSVVTRIGKEASVIVNSFEKDLGRGDIGEISVTIGETKYVRYDHKTGTLEHDSLGVEVSREEVREAWAERDREIDVLREDM